MTKNLAPQVPEVSFAFAFELCLVDQLVNFQQCHRGVQIRLPRYLRAPCYRKYNVADPAVYFVSPGAVEIQIDLPVLQSVPEHPVNSTAPLRSDCSASTSGT